MIREKIKPYAYFILIWLLIFCIAKYWPVPWAMLTENKETREARKKLIGNWKLVKRLNYSDNNYPITKADKRTFYNRYLCPGPYHIPRFYRVVANGPKEGNYFQHNRTFLIEKNMDNIFEPKYEIKFKKDTLILILNFGASVEDNSSAKTNMYVRRKD